MKHSPYITFATLLAGTVAFLIVNITIVHAFNKAARSMYTTSTTQAVIGDRVDISHTFVDNADKPIKVDQKARFSIKNPKAGQKCETTDDSLTDDGKISGYCEATSETGNMEVTVSTDTESVSFEGETYSFSVYETKNIMFSSKETACKDASTPPSAIVILKQNDVTVDVKWEHPESYMGSYEVLYGTTLGEYSSSKKTSAKKVVIDGMNSSKEYFFKVKATSICGNVTYSSVYKYTPLTAAVLVVSEKAATASASAKPSPSLRPTPTPKASSTLFPTPASSVAVVANTEATTSPSPASTPSSKTEKGRVISPVVFIAAGLMLPLIVGGGYMAIQARQKRSSTTQTPLG